MSHGPEAIGTVGPRAIIRAFYSMKRMLLNLCLGVIKRWPRGSYPIVRRMAKRFQELQRWPLTVHTNMPICADLRESVYFPLWRNGCYTHQLGEDKLTRQFLRDGDIVWDVGANIGYTALLYRSIIGECGEVVAFEPSPRIYAQLRRNVESWPNVKAINVAVSDSNGDVSFVDLEYSDRSAISSAEDDRPTTSVRSITLDSFLAQAGGKAPDFVKIDVEGHESAVFMGARKLIATQRPLFQFEALDQKALLDSVDRLDILGNCTYEIYLIASSGEPRLLDRNNPPTDARNFLAMTSAHKARFPRL